MAEQIKNQTAVPVEGADVEKDEFGNVVERDAKGKVTAYVNSFGKRFERKRAGFELSPELNRDLERFRHAYQLEASEAITIAVNELLAKHAK